MLIGIVLRMYIGGELTFIVLTHEHSICPFIYKCWSFFYQHFVIFSI